MLRIVPFSGTILFREHCQQIMDSSYKSILFGVTLLPTFSINNKGQEKPTERNEVAAACDLLYDLFLPSWSD